MARRRISQRQARLLEKRVAALESLINTQRSAWAHDWPGGVHLFTRSLGDEHREILTAKKLGHAVVCCVQNQGEVAFYALPLAATPLARA